MNTADTRKLSQISELFFACRRSCLRREHARRGWHALNSPGSSGCRHWHSLRCASDSPYQYALSSCLYLRGPLWLTSRYSRYIDST